MLAQGAPEAFQKLYQTEQDARLYTICPPIQEKLVSGAEFQLRITLFGPGVDFALAMTQAVMELGRTGLRPGGRYDLVRAEVIGAVKAVTFMTSQDGFVELPHAWQMTDILKNPVPVLPYVNVHFVTPTRIKAGNDLMRQAPSMDQLIRRIFGRIDQIGFSAQESVPLDKLHRGEIFEEAQEIELSHARIEPVRLERRSARSQQQMQFEGFVGSSTYTGHLNRSLHWLKLASLLQIGGKTAFGFGCINIDIQNSIQGEQHGQTSANC